jgi:hypothetical protein
MHQADPDSDPDSDSDFDNLYDHWNEDDFPELNVDEVMYRLVTQCRPCRVTATILMHVAVPVAVSQLAIQLYISQIYQE